MPDASRIEPPNLSRRLRAIGHLFEAEDEAQEWPELHAAIRQARTAYQQSARPPDFEALAELLRATGDNGV